MKTSKPESRPASDVENAARGDTYRFVATLLAAAPSQEILNGVAGLAGDATAFGQAVTALARAARATDAAKVEREFFELFIGVGRGELLPYASFYQTGFLNERPLAEVRADLSRLGIARAEGRFEPEDHIALLFEVMADLASGAVQTPATIQAAFFGRHIEPWAAQFFDDLAIAPSASFYRAVAEVGRLLVDIEARAFSLAA
ncbi:TorD/DmsD family molecular chaperone [Roseicyclus persicicus]|uniref:Molecular chaperone TorD family protein n=1 Tax=Roseicyclus persicicus TaxID=2650661 RepID=A0A7X6GY27_9RHOB|nr:molecular chaperone TorD family protein [Roseibacterium persicicum]NKX44491.1 molecular chaperone TorD family protein [Roseibacterium persicicum]